MKEPKTRTEIANLINVTTFIKIDPIVPPVLRAMTSPITKPLNYTTVTVMSCRCEKNTTLDLIIGGNCFLSSKDLSKIMCRQHQTKVNGHVIISHPTFPQYCPLLMMAYHIITAQTSWKSSAHS
ncbi:hypothetical protein LOAG_01845 [Loa loa]|uniref:Uncharacterized protein n=1 Tax=Loa loa TaxID=7209 RepID=A0A1S0U7U0_LOALO|nr:hypothetical protein LOAG_01845 [Loa loa]EFO26637.1 hypothetical protein LOAG_01845 [Loa loa]